ncbi:hypothetical protein EKE94_05160 [Mesobaculum littorinae]|uniref:Uncharacterized protein n=1 Tax=Mesobaculum littorinae TaxID=2486419 RepID=A0A438AHY3_9RHOB|nr:hypothetical protein [Mesobaculum littorinae]RVV98320.1 hypothetical protein EKE94_05160 [Mesobaculum littorinae]
MPPGDVARVIAFGGTGKAIVTHHRNVFDPPEIMASNADHAASLAQLPITATSVEGWARLFNAALTRD